MKIAVLGAGGHVGLVTAATLAKLGHEVVGQDIDEAKIASLRSGREPFYEPDQQELIEEAISAGRLRFTLEPEAAIPGAEAVFLCVWTDIAPDGSANMVHVENAATAVGKHATQDLVVVSKSTVPVQTAERIQTVLRRMSGHEFHVVSNPEFLREGHAVADSLEPDRILVGSDTARGLEVMRQIYAPLIERGIPYFETDVRTAEIAKHATNAFLALKISFANALAFICDLAGADVVAVADIMGADPRIGRAFLNAGLGYGGYCFPKDIPAFRAQARALGYDFRLLDEIVAINQAVVDSTVAKVKEALWNLEGKRIVLFGLSYKPGTDDIRESPALRLAEALISSGARVSGYDPKAAETARTVLPDLETSFDPYAAAEGADCIVICTEWPEFRDLDFPRLKGILTHPIIIDARNVLDPAAMAEGGFTYLPTGRPPVNL